MPLDQYVTLGRSGLRVSPFCLGTMTFGTQWGWGSDDAESTAILDRYLDLGGNFLDTANAYTKGYSEQFIGDYFAGRRVSRGHTTNNPRDRVVIATKFMANMYPGDPNGGGAGRKAVIAACEQSLRRLRTDYIDLYWAHFHDGHTPLDEMVRAMDDLVTAGKVRYIGLSDHPAWVCASCQHLLREVRGHPLIALQIEYSLAERTVEGELIPMARHFGMGVTPWSPLRGGVLTGKYTRQNRPPVGETRVAENSPHLSERNYQIIDALIEVAGQVRHADGTPATPAQVALRWVQDRPGVASTIIGARTLKQLDDNVRALDIALTPPQRARLDDVSNVKQAFPFDFIDMVKTAIHGGTSINGVKRDPWPLAPKTDAERC